MAVTAAIDEEFRSLLEAFDLSPDAVFVTDRRNRIVFWNKAVERLLGYTAREVVGYSCAGVLLGLDHWGNRYCSDPCPVVQIANRGEAIRRFELQMTTKEKLQLHVEVTILNVIGPLHHHLLLPHIICPVEKPPAESTPPPAVVNSKALGLTTADARARKLTPRELEVLTMLASGVPCAEIAGRLAIAALTARNHIQNILEKLEVHSKAEAVAFAYKRGLL
jgi:DNA-binding CsgD family transcriptional regulator